MLAGRMRAECMPARADPTATILVAGTGARCPLSFARYLVSGAGGKRTSFFDDARSFVLPPASWLSVVLAKPRPI